MSNRRTNGNHLRRRGGALLIAVATAFCVTTIDGMGQKPSGPARKSAGANTKPAVIVNRTVPRVSPPPARPVFSDVPTETELRMARVFREPLVPLGSSSGAENAALAAAVTRYAVAANLFEVAPFTEYLDQQPSSVWRASLQANLGGLHRAAGYYTRALRAWDEAWALSKDDRSVQGRAIADFTAGQALDMLASMGQVAGLDRWLERTKDRAIAGPAASKAERAREVRALIATHPERVIPSGPKAIEILIGWQSNSVTPPLSPALATYQTTAAGTSLSELRTLASRAGLSMKMVRREAGAPLVAPAIVHLGFDHFTAVLEEKNGAFRVRDPALGGEIWMSREALDEEMSGAALIARTSDAPGWRELSDAEAETVVGHSCPPGLPDPDECPCPESDAGMPVYSLHPVQASVLIADAPLEYAPPRGPAVRLQLRYNHREENQPQSFSFANVGARWTANWLSYAEEVPFTWYGEDILSFAIPQHVAIHVPGGGVERFKDDGSGVFTRHHRSAAVLVKIADSPLTFERRHPDGSKEVYATPDGGTPGTRRSFLSSVVDPHGQALTFTWDASFKLVAVIDALGQVTTLQYMDGDPLKITSVTDPFGRIARLTYDGGGHLSSVTDVINLRSSFNYWSAAFGTPDFIYAMQTPYGTTSFRTPTITGENARAVEATDPLGAVERVEFWWMGAPVPATVPADQVPPGFESRNTELDTVTSLHWGKGRNVSNVQEAFVWRWMLHSMDYRWDPGWAVGVPHSVQPIGEARTWFNYIGPTARPSRVARKLPDGTVYEVNSTYNYQDKLTWRKDPVGRELTYVYAPNGLDLWEIRNTTGDSDELLAQYSNYTAGLEPQTIADAAGQSTQLTYNTDGGIATLTNPKQERTVFDYDPNGYLRMVTGPVAGAIASYAYDGHGRLRAATLAGESLVTWDYDALNRPTRATYPDGTYEELIYDRLDVVAQRDRGGRVTRLTHDASRRLIAARDPAGRVLQQRWCICGPKEALIDGNGNTTQWERDASGRVQREVRADGATETRYTYDALGRVRTVTDPKQQMATYSYYLDGAAASLSYTNAQIPTPGVTWTYDPAYPRPATMVDGTGTTTFAYHAAGQSGAGQVATVDGPLPADDISYAYDQLGRMLGRTIAGASVTWSYDALGRVEREINPLGTFSYSFDGFSGRLATATYPNSQTSSYTYFSAAQDHRLQTILHRYADGGTMSKFDYTYDPGGNILTWRQQADTTSVIWEYDYDRAQQITRAVKRATDPQGTVIARMSYGYDAAGNRLFEQVDDTVTSWTYDRLNRLVSQQVGGLLRVSGTVTEPATVRVQGQPVAVEASGGFVGQVQVGTGTTRFVVSATDASGNSTSQNYDVDQSGSFRTFTFDSNGNLNSDGTRAFEWDARNQLTALTAGTHRTEFGYDGFMRRIRTIEKENGAVQADSRTLWCGPVVCEDRSADGSSVTRRTFERAEQVGGAGRFFARDHLGSVLNVTDAQSAVLASYAYDPWGRRTVTSGVDATLAGFTGHQSSISGLSLTLYRAYDHDLGRWLSEDPISLAGGVNLYAYVGNNPLNLRDPLGLEPCAETPCDELLKGILRLGKELSDRYDQYKNPKWQLPLTGKMSRESHINAIKELQNGVLKRIKEYNDQNCPTPIPTPVEDVATKPLPVLSPSPVHLPELPPPTSQQMADMGAKLTMGLLMTAAMILIILFG